MSEQLLIPHRFRGPVSSGNGGWTAGAVAGFLDLPGRAVQVRLSAPPPLDVPLDVVTGQDGAVEVLREGRLVARAELVADDLEPVPPVTFAQAVEAGERYAGLADHPFPTCFACGTGREPGDGLLLRPGPLAEPDGTTAAAWVPHAAFADPEGLVERPVVWAALDCPGGWAVDIVGRPMVLGTMTAVVTRPPKAGDRCVVRGQVVAEGARTSRTRTTLYGEDGDVLGRAAHVWVVVDPALFQA